MRLKHENALKITTIRAKTNCIRRSGGAALCLTLCAAALSVSAYAAGGSDQLREKLYVVDTDHQDMDGKAQVLVVDPQQKVVVATYRAGYHPDLAVSPDGKRLYLSYDAILPDDKTKGQLDVIDTASGSTIASVSNPNRTYDTFDDLVSHMAVSSDGRLLYVAKVKDLGSGEVSVGVAVFDTSTNKFLSDTISLPGCENATLLPSPAGHTLSVVCTGSRDVRIARFDVNGVPLTRLPVGIPFSRTKNLNVEIATAFVSGDAQITIIFADGNYSTVSLDSRKQVQEGTIAFSPPLSANNRCVGPYSTPVWHDKAYLAIPRIDDFRDKGLADVIAVLNVKTLKLEALIEPGKLFSSVAVGDSGIHLADPKGASVYSFDAATGMEKGKMESMGVSPTLVFLSH